MDDIIVHLVEGPNHGETHSLVGGERIITPDAIYRWGMFYGRKGGEIVKLEEWSVIPERVKIHAIGLFERMRTEEEKSR